MIFNTKKPYYFGLKNSIILYLFNLPIGIWTYSNIDKLILINNIINIILINYAANYSCPIGVVFPRQIPTRHRRVDIKLEALEQLSKKLDTFLVIRIFDLCHKRHNSLLVRHHQKTCVKNRVDQQNLGVETGIIFVVGFI